MGGTQSKNSNNTQVQQIRNSINSSKSPNSKSPKLAKSPSKVINQSPKKKQGDLNKSDRIVSKQSSTTMPDLSRQSETLAETRGKKKIKSVRVLPAGIERSTVVEDAEEEPNTLKHSDRKAKNQKMQLHKLMRIYDLA